MESRSDVQKERTKTSTVKGGWVKREATTGRFVEVQGERGVAKASPKSEAAAKVASAKRYDALKRLADR